MVILSYRKMYPFFFSVTDPLSPFCEKLSIDPEIVMRKVLSQTDEKCLTAMQHFALRTVIVRNFRMVITSSSDQHINQFLYLCSITT